MNIKLEIEGEKYEIEVTEHDELVFEGIEWTEDERYYSYEIWRVPSDGEEEMLGEETDYETVGLAASAGLGHLIDILASED